MRFVRNNDEFTGTPDEIAQLLDLIGNITKDIPKPYVPEVTEADFEPVIEEAKTLRQKLAENPQYSEFGGVLPPLNDPDAEINIPVNSDQADLDTGVSYA